jgi:hypothetical protein
MPAFAQGTGEGFLHDLACEVVTSDHACEDVSERPVTVTVELFERVCMSIHLHLPIPKAAVSFSGAAEAVRVRYPVPLRVTFPNTGPSQSRVPELGRVTIVARLCLSLRLSSPPGSFPTLAG